MSTVARKITRRGDGESPRAALLRLPAPGLRGDVGRDFDLDCDLDMDRALDCSSELDRDGAFRIAVADDDIDSDGDRYRRRPRNVPFPPDGVCCRRCGACADAGADVGCALVMASEKSIADGS